LKKSVEEICLLTQDEFYYWIAYFKVKAEKEKLHGRQQDRHSPKRNR